MLNLKSIAWNACNELQKAQLLITNTSILQHLSKNNLDAKDLQLINNNLHLWINEWRLNRTNQYANIDSRMHLAKNKVLENELYKYKNNLYRISQKCKMLEKKIRSLQYMYNSKQQYIKDKIHDLLNSH